MIRLPKSAVSFGAVALVACVATLAVPRAAHSFAAALVQVTNTAASPVLNQDVDALGRYPFLMSCVGTSSCNFSAVPANRELVIQTLSVGMTIPPNASQTIAVLGTVTGGTFGYPVQFPVYSFIEGFGYATQSFTAYADPGTTPSCGYVTSITVANASIACSITGYTISTP